MSSEQPSILMMELSARYNLATVYLTLHPNVFPLTWVTLRPQVHVFSFLRDLLPIEFERIRRNRSFPKENVFFSSSRSANTAASADAAVTSS